MKSGCCRKFLSAFGPLRSCLLLGGRVVWVKGKLDRTVPQSVTQQLAGCDFCKSISKLSPPTLSTCSRITRSSRLVLLSVAPWLMLSLWKLSLSAVASVMKAGVRGVGDLQDSRSFIQGSIIICQNRTTNSVLSTACAAA